MSVELANEIWSELKRYINTVDRDEAAETLVSVLIDNDIFRVTAEGKTTRIFSCTVVSGCKTA